MMQRIAFALAVVIFASCNVETRANDLWAQFSYVCRRDYKRNNCWPQPFTYVSKQTTKVPFFIMIDNGWRRQNLLGDHYFEQDSQQLTLAGQLKIRHILTQLPPARRGFFVQRGWTTDATLARVDAVRAAITQIRPEGELPPIFETDLEPIGTPADYVEHIGRSYIDTIPPPRLPEVKRTDLSL
jgi:hypothetical protein